MPPLLVPFVLAADIDLMHLDIVVIVNPSTGFFTSTFGTNLSVVQADRVSVIYRGGVPFVAVNLFSLALITYIPPLSLWLVD